MVDQINKDLSKEKGIFGYFFVVKTLQFTIQLWLGYLMLDPGLV